MFANLSSKVASKLLFSMLELNKKIIVLGAFGVGKTSIINRFVHNRFPEDFQSTIGVRIEKKTVELSGGKLNMVIWDIAGERDQKYTPQSYFLGSGGIVYVFDITNPLSYSNAQNDVNFLKEKLKNVPILLVANKIDLISQSELKEISAKLPIKPDFYTSAKNNNNIETVFTELSQLILKTT